VGLLARILDHVRWRLGLTPEARSKRAIRELGLREADTVIDCGANVGTMTSVMAEGGATVHAFEPNPHACVVLRRKFEHNPRVKVHEAAVHISDGTLRLHLHENSIQDEVYWSNGSSLLADKPNVSGERFVEVRTVDLAAFIGALPGRVRLLKVDIEGAEVEVLRRLIEAGSLDKVDILFVETHENKMPWLQPATAKLKKELAAHPTCQARFDWV
jgi:FkbM family methyltransferase